MVPLGITRLANITGLDIIGIPVFTACRPNARSLAVSQGKGLDLDSARASALMECIELHHAEHITAPLVLASLQDLLARRGLVSVDLLPRVAVSAFHRHRSILWIEGDDLLGGTRKLLPYEVVHCNYALPLPAGSGCFAMSSNGLASGNEHTEAVLHGLYEVIERDATTLWALEEPVRQQQRCIALETIDDADCQAVLQAFAAAGVSVGIWDMTTDVGLPAFACMIAEAERSTLRLLYPTHGMGCHAAREVALLRAMTEAAQARLTFIAGSRDDLGPEKYADAQGERAWREARARLDRQGSRNFHDVPSFQHTDLADDLRVVLERLRRVGLTEALVVDLTQPHCGIPVVRVVVPGLEPLYELPGYVPGPRARRVLEARAREEV
jgi:YcaO-like protein with predicted kinase domain